MPICTSDFHPPWLLCNGHVQTVLAVLLRQRRDVAFERDRLEFSDGDFLDLNWARAGEPRLAVLSHDLEGCSTNGCIRGMAATLRGAGWNALAWNFRGCGPKPNRLARFHHSGETRELAEIISHAAATYRQIALIGFRLGGNIMLKYLGGPAPHSAVVAGAAISAPVDLAASVRRSIGGKAIAFICGASSARSLRRSRQKRCGSRSNSTRPARGAPATRCCEKC